MADGIFERGEIYAVRMDSGFGSEEGMFRPGVIVSSNKGNITSTTVNVCYMTTKFRRVADFSLETMATGLRSWILVAQIATVDKTRLGKWMGVLNEAELDTLDKKLKVILDLTASDDAALREKDREIHTLKTEMEDERAELKAKIAELERELATKDSSVISLEVENEMWKRLYGKALDQVVDMKLIGDIQRRVETPAAAPVVAPVVEEPVVTEEIDERVDVNSCTATALRKIGFAPGLAKSIIAKRPFKSVEDLKKVPGMKSTQYQIMEPKLKCTPIAEEPKQEPEKEPEKKIVSALPEPEPDPDYEAEGPVVVPEEPVEKKVNINTASALEICNATGLNMTVCYSITGCRKRNGLYKSVDDLLNIPKFTAHHMKKYGAMMEV